MLLTITTTYKPATDLGYLLHKNPARVQSFKITSGEVHIFYPEASEEKCTVAMLVELDTIDLVRNLKTPGNSLMLTHYVNDRPYVSSSLTSSAIAKVFSTAMNGTCKEKPELVNTPIPLEVNISSVAAKGGASLIERLFKPLGYKIKLEQQPLNEDFPEWGESNYFKMKLEQTILLKDLLSHLYLLLPVLDNDKHYYISKSEVEKLLAKGGDWLKEHPEKEFITKRFLKRIGKLTKHALAELIEEEEVQVVEEEDKKPDLVKINLHQQRLNTVYEELKASQSKSVLDLGCGEGKLLRLLLKDDQFKKIVGVDVSARTLIKAKERLHWERMPEYQKKRIALFQGALTYRDKRLQGYDAAALVEVIEHMDLDRLPAFEKALFGFAQPKTVIITTPNFEYNKAYEQMKSTFRHTDHRFEWTRQEFKDWSAKICQQFAYEFTIKYIGEEMDEIGTPSQMVIFTQKNQN